MKNKLLYEPRNPAVGKVLIDMTGGLLREKANVLRKVRGKGPKENEGEEKFVKVYPLICYWFALYPRLESECL